MSSVKRPGAGAGASGDRRRRRRTTTAIKESLRELGIQLALLNRQVGARATLKDGDLGCLDLIGRLGPLSPSTLARRAGLHPATMTGILDRLEQRGWIDRYRDPDDRRAVLVRGRRDRAAEMFGLYAGMNTAMDRVLDHYDETGLEVIADFLSRTTEAGRAATEKLAEGK
jgi:DNA-binding MarR family transcriptional regulator